MIFFQMNNVTLHSNDLGKDWQKTQKYHKEVKEVNNKDLSVINKIENQQILNWCLKKQNYYILARVTMIKREISEVTKIKKWNWGY
jgi:hypothetical protein